MRNSRAKVTILADNRADAPLVAEHGLALWIESGSRKILLDTGQGESFFTNASLLGIDLRETDTLVLSHGHYDHTGSVARVLEEAPQVDVYLHPAAFLPRYSHRNGQARPVQAPGTAMSSIIAHPEPKVHWVNGVAVLANGINITGPIPRKTDFEDTGGTFSLDPEGRTPDLIRDDLALWISTDEGLVICTGCCHSGIVNTLSYIMLRSGEERIKSIVGGLHLVNAGRERLQRTVEELNKLNIEELVPCHCTGDEAVAYLYDNLDCRVTPGYAGMRV